jgi:hypothetical protein
MRPVSAAENRAKSVDFNLPGTAMARASGIYPQCGRFLYEIFSEIQINGES